MKMEARFDVLLETDMFIMIVDRDDGGLVGGASLKVDDFLAICQSAG